MKYTVWLEQDCGGGHTARGYLTKEGELTPTTERAVLLELEDIAAQLPDLSYEHTSLLTCKIEAEE